MVVNCGAAVSAARDAGETPAPQKSQSNRKEKTQMFTKHAMMLAAVAAGVFGGTVAAEIFTNPDGIWISDAPDPWPSTINVTGLSGTIAGIKVRIAGLWHQQPDDIDMLLVGPQGQTVMLMSDVGGSCQVVGVDLLFIDGKPPLPNGCTLTDGSYRPTNAPPFEDLPDPTPNPPYGTTLSNFNGTDPNGIWKLFIYDDYWFEYGSLESWSIIITLQGELDSFCEGDANGDNTVDPLDAGYVSARFGCTVGTSDPECDAADQNGDGMVDPLDFGFVLARFGDCG